MATTLIDAPKNMVAATEAIVTEALGEAGIAPKA